MQELFGVPRRELIRVAAVLVALVVGIGVVGWMVGLVLVGHGASSAGQAVGLDESVRHWVSDHSSSTNAIASALSKVFGTAGGVLIAGGAGVLVWWRGGRFYRAFVPLLATLATGAVLTVLKAAIARPRPTVALNTTVDAYSFPSGHATTTAALLVAMALVWLPPRWRTPGLVVAGFGTAAVAASRLVLDVHWFTDVAIGAVIGTALAVAVASACQPLCRYEEPSDREAEAVPSPA